MKLWPVVHRVQDQVLTALGGDCTARGALVHGMLRPKGKETAGYWLQLIIATMLATLGLALSSTAVVIGAMLIAPLMKPLVELAMGLATGSAALTLRAAIRTVASIAVVVGVAVVLTWLLPFHEITTEIAARTAPSLLDLAIAGACALAAAYATLRADADIAVTAAGTSIGISLVPPLCAAGYGLAIQDFDVAGGAALLFTANLSGILSICAVMFLLAGLGRPSILKEMGDYDAQQYASRGFRIGHALGRITTKRLGPFSRIVPPLMLLGIVFVPLQRAVGEIKRRSEIRQAVANMLGKSKQRVVQYTLDHTASDVILRVVVVGDAKTSTQLESALRSRLAKLNVPKPTLSVWAVPDAASLSALTTRLDALPPPSTPEPASETVQRYTAEAAQAIRAMWPVGGSELVAIALDLDHPDKIRLTELGAPLGPTGLQLLSQVARAQLGDVTFSETALQPVTAQRGDAKTWLPNALTLVASALSVPGLHVCITSPTKIPTPETGKRRPPPPTPDMLADANDEAYRAVVLGLTSTNIGYLEGTIWRAAPSKTACTPPSTTTPGVPTTTPSTSAAAPPEAPSAPIEPAASN